MTPDAIAAAAEELLDMRAIHRVEADLPEELRPASFDDAYAIQREVVAGLLPAGARPIGFKAACTSPIAQAALEVDAPLFGRVLSHSSSPSGSTLAASGFVHRVIEAEFAFRLGRDVMPVDGGHTIESIASFIDAVIPAIEVVDYHYVSWTIGARQVAADNAIHGAWVHGSPLTDWRTLDLATTGVTLRVNGVVMTTGSGAAVLGHPLAVMAWIADELPRFGLQLRAGDVVTTGVTTDVFEATAGDAIEAVFDGIGSVSVRFE
ncbi:MAG TPA: fumarylacetoacetate hydrolase family protein [Ilumatobacter sp.]